MAEKSQVALLFCSSYQEEEVYQAVKEGIRLLGGLEAFFQKEERILLKPNLLKKSQVDKAVITHPAVAGAFMRLLAEKGYTRMSLGDSCGTGNTKKVIRGTEMESYLEKYQVEAVNFDEGELVSYPKGVQAKEFMLCKEVEKADAVVSLCKMKTHALERITGAVKNSYGFIYGFYKAKGHTQYPSADSFARMLVDLNQMVKPRLYLMDGIVAMEGNGPGSGDPVWMKLLLLSKDPVALDSVFSYLVDLKPALVPTSYHGEKMGLGVWQKEKIQILTPKGEISMEEAVKLYGNKNFRVDRTPARYGVWQKMAKVLNVFQKKPYILEENCIKCGICVESCPVVGKAVSFQNGKDQVPVYDYKKCIRCFCCQEMCPKKAIQVK